MHASLGGITVFLTGAASGIGRVTAGALAKAGASCDAAARRRLREASLLLVAPLRRR
jgi:NAD(P)-dependent dehydrogenase (short-subunit alcohol dehydrogenase family)